MADELKFLDQEGLATLISKIKTALGQKANTDDVQPKGNYATLNSDGQIPASQLPSYVDDIVEMGPIGIEEPSQTLTSTTASSTDNGYYVVYTENDNFYLAQIVGDGASLDNPNYYEEWADKNSFCNSEGVPYTAKIYVTYFGESAIYRYDGENFIKIPTTNLVLGETSSTAYAGDKGAQNAKDIAAIKAGDLPLAPMYIGNIQSDGTQKTPWTILLNTGAVSGVSTDTVVSNLTTTYGYYVMFNGNYMWKSEDGYKDPTAVNGGDWSSKALPASGVPSENITAPYITKNTTFTASVKAPRQGLIYSNGIIKQASATDFDTKSASISVTFQYKVVATPVTSALDATSLTALLAAANKGGTWNLQNNKNKTLSSVTTGTNEYYVYAYPAVLGNLSRITMNDATPLLSDGFTKTVFTVTDPETKCSLEYNVYTSVQKGAFTDAKLDIA